MIDNDSIRLCLIKSLRCCYRTGELRLWYNPNGFNNDSKIRPSMEDITMADQPALNLNSIMIGTSQPDVLAEFYQKVFARPADMHDGTFYGWQAGSSSIAIMEHSEVKGQSKEPARMILNLETTAVKE